MRGKDRIGREQFPENYSDIISIFLELFSGSRNVPRDILVKTRSVSINSTICKMYK